MREPLSKFTQARHNKVFGEQKRNEFSKKMGEVEARYNEHIQMAREEFGSAYGKKITKAQDEGDFARAKDLKKRQERELTKELKKILEEKNIILAKYKKRMMRLEKFSNKNKMLMISRGTDEEVEKEAKALFGHYKQRLGEVRYREHHTFAEDLRDSRDNLGDAVKDAVYTIRKKLVPNDLQKAVKKAGAETNAINKKVQNLTKKYGALLDRRLLREASQGGWAPGTQMYKLDKQIAEVLEQIRLLNAQKKQIAQQLQEFRETKISEELEKKSKNDSPVPRSRPAEPADDLVDKDRTSKVALVQRQRSSIGKGTGGRGP